MPTPKGPSIPRRRAATGTLEGKSSGTRVRSSDSFEFRRANPEGEVVYEGDEVRVAPGGRADYTPRQGKRTTLRGDTLTRASKPKPRRSK